MAAGCVAGVLAAGLIGPAQPSAAAQTPDAVPCPANLVAKATCYSGQDSHGAHYTVAIPHTWNGTLVMHAHGGPGLGAESDPQRSADDLERWSVMVDEGYAWAGSAYRRGGYGTRMAASDTENLRRLFTERFGRPRTTLIHGQSWGGNVAAKTIEMYGGGAGSPYDGALLTNGVLAGGSRGYDYRVDLRVVHQYYCRNHPRPSEPSYPLWMGLREDVVQVPLLKWGPVRRLRGVTRALLEPGAQSRTGHGRILAVTKIPERTLESHLSFATFTFRDIVGRLGLRSPFSNLHVRYSGSHDDAALNAGVERFSADPTARRDLSYDSDLTGAVSVPVLTMHAIDDPTAFVEHEAAYRDSLEGAHRDRHLVQTFTQESEHSGLSTSEYASAVSALSAWVRTGRPPTPASVAASCPAFDAGYGTGCFFRPDHRPASYASRVNPRAGAAHWPAMTRAQERRWSRLENVGIAP